MRLAVGTRNALDQGITTDLALVTVDARFPIYHQPGRVLLDQLIANKTE